MSNSGWGNQERLHGGGNNFSRVSKDEQESANVFRIIGSYSPSLPASFSLSPHKVEGRLVSLPSFRGNLKAKRSNVLPEVEMPLMKSTRKEAQGPGTCPSGPLRLGDGIGASGPS